MDPVMEEIFAHEANEDVQGPFEESGEGEGVAHAEVLGEGVGYDANWHYNYKIIKNECFHNSNIICICGVFPFLNLVFIQKSVLVDYVKYEATKTIKKSHREISKEEKAEASNGLVQGHPRTLYERGSHLYKKNLPDHHQRRG